MDTTHAAQPYEPLHFTNENAPNTQAQPSQVNTALSNNQHQPQQPPVQQQFYPVMQQQPQYGIPVAQHQAPYTVTAPPGTTQTQPVVIQVPRQRTPPEIKENYNSKLSKILGIVQLVAGGLALVLNCIGIAIQVGDGKDYYGQDVGIGKYHGNYYYNPTNVYYGCVGIWCYTFFALSGSFAICAAARKTKCRIVAHMVLAIIASVFAFLMLAMAFWAFGHDVHRLRRGFEVEVVYYDFNTGNFHYDYVYAEYAVSSAKGSMAVSTFWVLASLLEFVTCIWSSTLCCRVMCCAQQASTIQANVQYTTNSGPSGTQLLVLDSQGQPVPGAQVVQVPSAGGQVNQGYSLQPSAPGNQQYTYQVQQGGATATPQGTAMNPPPYKI